MRGGLRPQQVLTPRILYVAIESENVVGLVAGHLTRRFDCTGELKWINVLPNIVKKVLLQLFYTCCPRGLLKTNRCVYAWTLILTIPVHNSFTGIMARKT